MSPVSARFRQAALLLSLSLLATGLGGCFTTITKQASKRSPDSTQVPTRTEGTAAFALAQVLRSTSTSTLTFDLIGDGTGAMGQYCAPTSGGESATTCNCDFAYTLASGASENIEVPTTYGEANLVRCRYDRIPADATYAKVKLHATSSGAYSSEVLYRFTGAGAANLSDPESFAKVLRYQCRDIVTIPNLLDSRMYDPFQSEDRSITYPLNYYTTNLGGTYALYASKNVEGWYCPPIPNDPDEGMNLTTFSVNATKTKPDGTTDAALPGSYLIYPPENGYFDRSTFHVSKLAVGAFTVPINAYIAPRIVTGATASALAPPIGYGASPIPNSSGGEDCPNIVKPAGYNWAKLWLFRADLPSRNYVGSAKLPQLGAVSCNPGKWNTGTPVFNSCGTDGAGGGLTVADGIADRILGTNMCVRMQPYGATYSSFAPCAADQNKGPGCTTQPNGTQYASTTSYAKGTDTWLAISEVLGCGSPTLQDPMKVCDNATQHVPYEPNPPFYDLDGGRARFDYLFVVTPTSVNAVDMQNTSSAIHRTYTPFRFPKSEDCAAVNPNGCDINKAIQYGLKLHDVSGNGDPPGNDPTRPGQFPVCVLQESS